MKQPDLVDVVFVCACVPWACAVLLISAGYSSAIFAQENNARTSTKPAQVSSNISAISELGSEEQAQLRALHTRAEKLLIETRYRDALPIAKKALALAKRKPNPKDPALIPPMIDLANVQKAIGHYRKVLGHIDRRIEEYSEAESLYQNALNAMVDNQASTASQVEILTQLSEIKAQRGDFDNAVRLKRRELELRQHDSGNLNALLEATNALDVLEVAKLINSSSYAKALPLAIANLENVRCNFGPSHPIVARALSNLASVYRLSKAQLRGAAIGLEKQALDLRLIALGRKHWESLASTIELAKDYRDTKQYAESGALLAQAVQTGGEVLGPEDIDVVELTLTRAEMLLASDKLGNVKEALVVYEQQMPDLERQFAKGNSEVFLPRMRALEGMAEAHRVLGNYDRAFSTYEKILGTHRKHAGPGPLLQAAFTLRNLGSIHRLRGEFREAEALYQQALDSIEPELNEAMSDPHAMTAVGAWSAWTLEELAATALARGEVQKARDYLRRAAPIEVKEHRAGPSYDFDTVADSVDAATARGDYRFYYMWLWIVARHFANDQAAVSEALDLVVQRKMLGLDRQSQMRGQRALLSKEQQGTLEQLAAARSEVASLMLKGRTLPASEFQSRLTMALENEAALASAQYKTDQALQLSRPTTKASSVIAKLPATSALIEFVRVADIDYPRHDFDRPFKGSFKYLAFVAKAGGEINVFDLGKIETIDTLISDVQGTMRNPEATRELIEETLQQAYAGIWAPLVTALGSVEKVIISPDSELFRLPFAALLDAKGRYLVQSHAIAYVSSARDLLATPQKRPQSSAELVLVADPDYGTSKKRDDNAQPTTLFATRAFDHQFARLLGTADEARLVPPLLGGKGELIILTGQQATEAAVKQIKSPRILHLATHGFFVNMTNHEADAPEYSLASSGLALAGANQVGELLKESVDDGLLTALEVSGMDLTGTDLVVLSACDSGVGQNTSGQGVIGLRRAFVLAGTQTLVATLWSVDDQHTAQFMEKFYQHLWTGSTVNAINFAQRQMIKEIEVNSKFANPRLWAPFILQISTGFR